MPHQDMTVLELAEYLHMSPQQVERLVQREELPMRKVGGEWRFSRAEVHSWLESRLGVFGDKELADVEGAMLRQAELHTAILPLTTLIRPELVRVPLLAKTKDSVIRELVALGFEAGMVWDPERMADTLRAREELMSTAQDNGIAILHPRRPQESILAQPYLALGITPQGIPFGGGRTLTDVFFCVCSISDRGHLSTLARLSRLLQRAGFLDELRSSHGPSEAVKVIARYEAQVLEPDPLG